MITTREINVDLTRGKLKLRQSTTKNIDASLRVEPPKGKIKPRGISTTTQADVADIAEKKRRDDIAIEKKIILKVDNEGDFVTVEKKPWNKMNAKERKEYQIEKAKKKGGVK